MFSRDEQRSRPEGLPPVERRHDDVDAIYPIDRPGRGTWIAATSAGLVFALLNGYETGRARPAPPDSRGRVVLELCSARTIDEVLCRLANVDVSRFRPFRLVAIDSHNVRETVSDGRTLRIGQPISDGRWMRTSSSVDPSVIEHLRTAVFARLVTGASVAAQNTFHAYGCAARPEAGIRMARPDARTVSVTTVDVFADRLRMTYRPFVSDTETVTQVPHRIAG